MDVVWNHIKLKMGFRGDRGLVGYKGNVVVDGLILRNDGAVGSKLVEWHVNDGFRFFTECDVCGRVFECGDGLIFYEEGFDADALFEKDGEEVFVSFRTGDGGGVFCGRCKFVQGLVE